MIPQREDTLRQTLSVLWGSKGCQLLPTAVHTMGSWLYGYPSLRSDKLREDERAIHPKGKEMEECTHIQPKKTGMRITRLEPLALASYMTYKQPPQGQRWRYPYTCGWHLVGKPHSHICEFGDTVICDGLNPFLPRLSRIIPAKTKRVTEIRWCRDKAAFTHLQIWRHVYLRMLLTLNRRRDVLNVTQKRLPYAERTFKTSPKR